MTAAKYSGAPAVWALGDGVPCEILVVGSGQAVLIVPVDDVTRPILELERRRLAGYAEYLADGRALVTVPTTDVTDVTE